MHCTGNIEGKAAEEYLSLSITSAKESTFEKFWIDVGLKFRNFRIKDLPALGNPDHVQTVCESRFARW